jgi:DNA/RNA endonuclease G (NUC1)/V8-like Glu-specific endopeptidase
MADPQLLCFNGINGATGNYLLPPMGADAIAAIAMGEPLDARFKKDLAFWAERAATKTFGLAAGIDEGNLADAGWGVIFRFDADPAIREALTPLLNLRKEQASKKKAARYKEFTGSAGYRPGENNRGESNREFLSRFGVEASQPADPDRGVPYYLLIVGSPEQIPFKFQYQLDVQYAVGRIWFDTLEEYAQYAESVVAAETRKVRVARKAVFFGVQNANDPATNLSATEMVKPLAERMPQLLADDGIAPWDITTIVGDNAKKAQLTKLLGGSETPSLLFTASHGMGFPNGDPRQLAHQGALLCQDWPGPRAWNRAIPQDHYFSADDVSSDANLQGMIAFHFACYGAGTPKMDDFAHQAFRNPVEIAPHAFVANLPRRLLGHPKGGALAVVGHVERAWGYSFFWNRIGRQLQTFESALYQVMAGRPLGSAIEYFNTRYAALSTELTAELEEIKFGREPDNAFLAGTWTAHNDARSYVILGDPAVRLPLIEDGEQESRTPATPIVFARKPVTSSPNAPAFETDPQSGENKGSTIFDQIAATEKRHSDRQQDQPSFDVPTSAGRLQRSNDPNRLRWRLEKLGVPGKMIDNISRFGVAFQAIDGMDVAPSKDVDDRWLERILGRNDMVDAPRFLDRGVSAAQAVCRVRIRSTSGTLRGWGTGSLISPRLLLTNNHVLGDATSAAASLVEFNVQDGPNGQPETPVAFRLRPEDLFITDKGLDFTLVAIADTSEGGRQLADFGHNPGTIGDDPILVSESVNIIQHPLGRPKQVALRENEVTDVLTDFLHYQTDTEPGSSGSPVFNDQWQLVALHHSGVPLRDSNGNILARDGSIWREEMGDNQIKWIANEGVRLSRILEFVRTYPLTSDVARNLRTELLSSTVSERTTPMPDQSASASNSANIQVNAPAGAAGTVTVTVPLNITVSLGAIGAPLIAPPAAQVTAATPVEGVDLQEAITIDPNYDSREGYDPEFLGTGSLRVHFPKLPPGEARNASRLLNPPAGADRHELKYHHYSVVMNGKRRLAFFTAVNIDGKKARDISRETDKWFFDPRISRQEQVGNELYASNPFDRGHLVRRLDPAWGRTERIAKVANDDTFHFTNCSPQHERFNQGQNLWQGVENFLLARATGADQKLTVFTGPVFRDNDPEYRGIQIPTEYWKVAVLVGQDGKLASLAFLVTQEDLIRPVVEEAAIDTARTFQTSVSEIERLTGLDFGRLRAHDIQSVDSFAAGDSTQTGIRIPLASLDQIRLSAAQGPVDAVAFGTGASAPVGRPNPREQVVGTDLSYYLLAYDANGQERLDHPAGKISGHVLSALEDEPVTDVFLFSHGWRGDVPAAKEQYQGWLKTMADCTADRARIRTLRPGFRPLLIGLHWPSEPWGDESLSGGVSFEPGAMASSVSHLVDDYATRLGDTLEVRRALTVIFEAAQTGMEPEALPDDVIAAYKALDNAVGLPKGGVAGAPGADWDGFDPEGVYESARRDATAQGSVSFGLFSRDTLLAPLRVLSFWKMKDRARVIGETAIHPLLRSMQRATAGRDVRFHLAGHSFGCIVVSAAVAGPPGGGLLARPVNSLVLLQGALSLWSYCSNIPEAPGKPGYFHRIVSQGLVRGPIVTTQSRFDTAVGTWYPRAASVAGQVVFAGPGQLPKYGAVGTFGIQGPGMRTSDIRMLPASGVYAFRSGIVYNIESSQVINAGRGFSGAHSDIRKLEVAQAAWEAVCTSNARP